MNIDYYDLITHLGKPFSSGCDRKAIYSEKYDVVVKRRIDGRMYGHTDQMAAEAKLFEAMRDQDFDIFPIINVVSFQSELFIVMEKCIPFEKMKFAERERAYCGMSRENKEKYEDFISRYEIFDLHEGNLALRKNGQVCIIDAGLNCFSELRNVYFAPNGRKILKIT